MIDEKTMAQLRKHGAKIMMSSHPDTAAAALSDLMCVVHCEIAASNGEIESIEFPRAILLSQREAAEVMDTGLAGTEPPQETIARWHKGGSIVYHNFIRSPQGELIADTMSAAPLIVGNSVEAYEYASDLLGTLAPFVPALKSKTPTAESFTQEAVKETDDLIGKLKSRREPPASAASLAPNAKP